MPTLTVTNWERWQSYRSDRGQPPWIKVHRTILRNPEWTMLTDAQRGQLVQIWILAADKAGRIEAPDSVTLETFIQSVCCMREEPNLEALSELGFIRVKHGVKATPRRRQYKTPTRRQHDVSVASQSRVEESREDKSSTTTAPKPKASEPTQDVPSVLVFPCRGNVDVWALTQHQASTWATLYPSTDVLGECRKALAWIQASPSFRRKTANGMPKFLVGWLNRAASQDGGGKAVGGNAVPQVEPKPCTCGDSYRNSYGRLCVDCNGKPSFAQMDACEALEP